MFKKYLILFFISMVPLIELRGSTAMIAGMDVSVIPAYLCCIVGNMVPVPLIFFFARKVLLWGANKKFIGKFFTYCLKKGHRGGEKLQAKAGKRGLFVALLLFVAIPIPGTGAWTGTLAASFIDMDFKEAVLAVLLGVAIAGIIMMLVGTGVVTAFSF